jgi:hypothetical protein
MADIKQSEAYMAKPGLVAKPIGRASARHRLAPSKINEPLVWWGRFVIPVYLRLALQFRGVEMLFPERLVDAVRDFQQHRTRLIVAFRHPYGDEPQLLFHVFENMVPRVAQTLGRPLAYRSHLRPVHDYAVALWGDAVIRFLLPRVGALPVYHVKFDSDSLNGIRAVMRNGPCPLGLAPEGQISYHSETLPRIEQGTVRMGFWCARDLEKAGRTEQVMVLPLSVHYRFDPRDARKIHASIARLEALCGLPVAGRSSEFPKRNSLLLRVEAIECRLLALTEAFYTGTYGYKAPIDDPEAPSTRHDRWMAIHPFALSVAEHLLGIDPKDEDSIQRMYRVRLEGWERIFPESLTMGQSPLEAALADRRAGEAWYAMRHMELVDLMSYHDKTYLTAATPEALFFDRLVETVTTLEDLAARLRGGNITNRPNRIRKRAVLVPGVCLNLSEQMPAYRQDVRQTTDMMTCELARRFEECIKEYRNGQS